MSESFLHWQCCVLSIGNLLSHDGITVRPAMVNYGWTRLSWSRGSVHVAVMSALYDRYELLKLPLGPSTMICVVIDVSLQ
jgi:hypothetical protein